VSDEARASQGIFDAESARREGLRVIVLGLGVWLSFFALDLFVVFVLHSEGGVRWFAELRILGGALLGGCVLAVRRPHISPAGVGRVLSFAFIVTAACISIMAIRWGGLGSRYIQGISFVIMYRAASIPNRWMGQLRNGLACALTFPATMAIAAAFDPRIAAQWRTPTCFWQFAHDYIFVIGTCLLGGAGSHMVWSARRQVFEARKLGKYRLKARIGIGGSSEVWLARDASGMRDVALKILHGQASQVASARARFEREARAAAGLHDPHTIRVIDWGASDDGVYFIAMELLDGADLATLVKNEGPMAPARAIHFLRQACTSLDEAHRAGILHRDIKPANLFAARMDGEHDFLKLLDFGLAKVPRAGDDLTVTHEGWVGGTPGFMAPEACAGRFTDERSDIYSLGAVLYFLLTGRPPFVATTAADVMMAHLNQPVLAPSQLTPLPLAIDEIVLRCLAKAPDERFASVRALDDALAALASFSRAERR
jgi:hypothetical protein